MHAQMFLSSQIIHTIDDDMTRPVLAVSMESNNSLSWRRLLLKVIKYLRSHILRFGTNANNLAFLW